MFEQIKPAAALFAITLAAALALGLVYDVTKGPIAAQKARDATDTLARLLPGTEATDTLEVSDEESSVTSVITALSGGQVIGYAVTAAPKGYGGVITLMVGFDPSGETVQGVEILSHAETPGLGANAALPAFTDQFKGRSGAITVVKVPDGDPGTVDAVASATITSNAVAQGVNDARAYLEALLRGTFK